MGAGIRQPGRAESGKHTELLHKPAGPMGGTAGLVVGDRTDSRILESPLPFGKEATQARTLPQVR